MKKTQSRWLKNRVKNGRKKKLKLSQLNWWCMSEWADPGTSKGYWGKRVSKEKGLVPYLGIFISPLSSLLWTFNNFKWLLVIGNNKRLHQWPFLDLRWPFWMCLQYIVIEKRLVTLPWHYKHVFLNISKGQERIWLKICQIVH